MTAGWTVEHAVRLSAADAARRAERTRTRRDDVIRRLARQGVAADGWPTDRLERLAAAIDAMIGVPISDTYRDLTPLSRGSIVRGVAGRTAGPRTRGRTAMTNRTEITDSAFRRSHGTNPRGHGGWMFQASRTRRAFDGDLFGPELTFCGTFTEACRQLRRSDDATDGTAEFWAVLP